MEILQLAYGVPKALGLSTSGLTLDVRLKGFARVERDAVRFGGMRERESVPLGGGKPAARNGAQPHRTPPMPVERILSFGKLSVGEASEQLRSINSRE